MIMLAAVGAFMYFALSWEIHKLEGRIADLEADLAVRSEEIFTEAQWREIDRRLARLRGLMNERLPPA